MIPSVPVTDPTRISSEEIQSIESAIDSVLTSGIFVGGVFVENFEHQLINYLDDEALLCVGTACGQDALLLSMLSLDLPKESLIAVPANDGGYSALAVQNAGLLPVLIDVDLNGNICIENIFELKDIILRNIKGVIVTHLHGNPANIVSISNWAKSQGVWVIEDCAQSLGASINGKKVGTFGDIAVFSFYPTKNLGAFGDAGALVSRHEWIAQRARVLKQYGWQKRYRISVNSGINSRLDAIQAAILSARIKFLDTNNQKRSMILDKYINELSEFEFLNTPKFNSVAHHAVVLIEKREKARVKLQEMGINTDVHYPYLSCEMPGLRPLVESKLTNSLKISRSCISLPCFPHIKDSEVEKVINSMKSLRKNV